MMSLSLISVACPMTTVESGVGRMVGKTPYCLENAYLQQGNEAMGWSDIRVTIIRSNGTNNIHVCIHVCDTSHAT